MTVSGETTLLDNVRIGSSTLQEQSNDDTDPTVYGGANVCGHLQVGTSTMYAQSAYKNLDVYGNSRIFNDMTVSVI